VLAISVKGTKDSSLVVVVKELFSISSEGFSSYCARFRGYCSGIISFCRGRLEYIVGLARESFSYCLSNRSILFFFKICLQLFGYTYL